jgi:hypothetical protein
LRLPPKAGPQRCKWARVRQLYKHHRRQMAPHRVAAGLGIHPMLPGGGLDDPLRNILEKLPQHIDMMA